MIREVKVPKSLVLKPQSFGQTGMHDDLAKALREGGIDLAKPFSQDYPPDGEDVTYRQEQPDPATPPPAVPVPGQFPPAVPVPPPETKPAEETAASELTEEKPPVAEQKTTE